MALTLEAAPGRLSDGFERILARAGEAAPTTTDVGRLLDDVYRMIGDVDFARLDLAHAKAHASALRKQMFDLRATLRGRLAGWQTSGLMSLENQLLLRDCMRASRFASDMLGEVSIGHERLRDGAAPMKAFRGIVNSLLSPDFDTDDAATFRAGDVLLLRGLHHNSAAIARIGDVDSQFSHLCIVHVDKHGKQWAVESLIEDGAVINPLGHTLAHGNGRAMLFRHPDAKLAARAGEIAYEHVRRTLGFWKRPILYDFTMRLDHRRPLFCSKLVRLAYERASKGKLLLPAFTTRFSMQNRDFIDRIGVEAIETFAPGDIEIDPRFALVAEWADFRATPRLRAQDLIMVKLFEWMELHGYKFEQDNLIRLVGILGRFSALWFEGVKTMLADVIPKVPRNMPRKTIAAVAMLHKTAEPLLEEIMRLDRENLDRTGRPLHPREVYIALENIRQRSGDRIGYLVLPKK